jgi:hypothetical protein
MVGLKTYDSTSDTDLYVELRRHRSRTPSERERVEQRYPTPNATGRLWHKCGEAIVLKPAQSHV